MAWYDDPMNPNPCPTAASELTAIFTAAITASEPYAAWLALRCTAHPMVGNRPDGSIMDEVAHCQHVSNAHAAMSAGAWAACIQELEHLGSGGGAPKAPEETEGDGA